MVLNIEVLKDKLRAYFENNSQTLRDEGGYCPTCAYSYDVEALTEDSFDYMLDEIDAWVKEQFEKEQ